MPAHGEMPVEKRTWRDAYGQTNTKKLPLTTFFPVEFGEVSCIKVRFVLHVPLIRSTVQVCVHNQSPSIPPVARQSEKTGVKKGRASLMPNRSSNPNNSLHLLSVSEAIFFSFSYYNSSFRIQGASKRHDQGLVSSLLTRGYRTGQLLGSFDHGKVLDLFYLIHALFTSFWRRRRRHGQHQRSYERRHNPERCAASNRRRFWYICVLPKRRVTTQPVALCEGGWQIRCHNQSPLSWKLS
jgi:hypothetical protein